MGFPEPYLPHQILVQNLQLGEEEVEDLEQDQYYHYWVDYHLKEQQGNKLLSLHHHQFRQNQYKTIDLYMHNHLMEGKVSGMNSQMVYQKHQQQEGNEVYMSYHSILDRPDLQLPSFYSISPIL